MSTLPEDVNYWKSLEVRPSGEFWIEINEVEIPTGTLIGYEGKAKISGLRTPHNWVFSPMDKICSSVRKRYQKETGVSVIGLFKLEQGVICATFLPNYAMCDDCSKAIERVNTVFTETFSRIFKQLFMEAIDSWLLDPEDGYTTYCQYVLDCVEKRVDPDYDHCNEMFNRWLYRAGFKTRKDEEKKQKFQKAIEESLHSSK